MAHGLHHDKRGQRPIGHISPAARVIVRAKRVLTILLMLGAMLGLLGVQIAAAATPVPLMTMAMPTQAQTASMPADCMVMMGDQAPQPDKQPCTGITLDCIAAMGCAMPFIGTAVELSARAAITKPSFSMPLARMLVGNDLAPEPEPPTILN